MDIPYEILYIDARGYKKEYGTNPMLENIISTLKYNFWYGHSSIGRTVGVKIHGRRDIVTYLPFRAGDASKQSRTVQTPFSTSTK